MLEAQVSGDKADIHAYIVVTFPSNDARMKIWVKDIKDVISNRPSGEGRWDVGSSW